MNDVLWERDEQGGCFAPALDIEAERPLRRLSVGERAGEEPSGIIMMIVA